MTSITAQPVDEMQERFCSKCSQMAGWAVIAEARTGVRPDQWVHPPRRAIIHVCRDFRAAGQPREEAPADQLEMFSDLEPVPYRHMPTGTRWDAYDAHAFGRKGRAK